MPTNPMSSAPCGYLVFTDDGTLVDVNRTACEILGFTTVELLGWHVDKILPPGGRIFFHTYLFPMMKVQGRADEIYVALRSKSGKDIPVLLNGVRREDGTALTNECVFLRMIQRHEFEQQLLEARRLAERSSAARSRFLSMMSHDIKTPLTAIYGNAQLLAEAVPSRPEHDYVAEILEACRIQTKLIDDILDFARMDAGRVQVTVTVTDVEEVVLGALALVQVQAADAGLTIRNECVRQMKALADPDRLMQVLLNLLSNAVKFTGAGGAITISSERKEDEVLIHVSDSGIGISSEDLKQIFEPFVQVNPAVSSSAGSARGVGLGLAISRELTNQMGGDLRVESTVGKGSIFSIVLKASGDVTEDPRPSALTESAR